MEDYLISMAINVVLTTIYSAIKNPTKKAKLRKALMKIHDAIEALYLADDMNGEENGKK